MLKKCFYYLFARAKQSEKGPSYIAPPPVLLLFTSGLGFFFSWLLPLGHYLPDWLRSFSALAVLALMLAVFALVLGCSCIYLFYKNNTSFHPGGVSTFVVGSGPYRFSRNPMYLSLLIMQFSLSLYFLSIWLLLTLAVLYYLLLNGVILPEEKYLSARFGRSYLKYKSSVRRWI